MRIRSLSIARWRHFENIEISIDHDASLVCIVGANGTGKSHLLELISACAHRLGLAQGIEIPRGDPFADPHDFSLQFYVAPGISDAIDSRLSRLPHFQAWDRTITIRDRNIDPATTSQIVAGGTLGQAEATNFAARVIETLRAAKDEHFLSLDADRAYPKKDINVNQIAQAYEIDWGGVEYTRGRSFRSTTTLYDEWMKYFLARENQTGTKLMQEMRRASKKGESPPQFVDHFQSYALSLQKVLPHVLFTGVDSKSRTLLFDTTGLELSFNQLSGGEREIAFLIGQIDRFCLRKGLFLIDEPELHLNADLIRTWVGYLTGTVESGQVWLATHSLEAVEAAGQHSTFVLERSESTRKVDGLTRLDSRPVLSALSRAVGTPAFAISQLRFVFVEGEESVGERERFRRLTDAPQDVRFLECGSCNEVQRRVEVIKQLATDDRTHIRIGGIVDRDFKCIQAISALSSLGLHILEVHEIENFFLHPTTLRGLLQQNGLADDPCALIRQAADARAGSWIFQYAFASANAKSLPEIAAIAKDRAKSITWANVGANRSAVLESIAAVSGYDESINKRLVQILDVAIRAYERRRGADDLWKSCEGKQVLNEIARRAGFSDAPALMRAAYTRWEGGGDVIPGELMALRSYLGTL